MQCFSAGFAGVLTSHLNIFFFLDVRVNKKKKDSDIFCPDVP